MTAGKSRPWLVLVRRAGLGWCGVVEPTAVGAFPRRRKPSSVGIHRRGAHVLDLSSPNLHLPHSVEDEDSDRAKETIDQIFIMISG